MKYVSLDIETSSLIPHPENVISLAMVVDDLVTPIDQLPRLHILFKHKLKDTDDYAMAMNSKLLYARASNAAIEKFPELKLTHVVKDWEHASALIKQFLHGIAESSRHSLAGKNVMGFDYQFLPQEVKSRFAHRALDPGSMYAKPEDARPPDTAECCRRAGIDDTVTHNALDDALQVIALIRKHWGISA